MESVLPLQLRYRDVARFAQALDLAQGSLQVEQLREVPSGRRLFLDVEIGDERLLLLGTKAAAGSTRLSTQSVQWAREVLAARTDEAARATFRWTVELPALLAGNRPARVTDLSEAGARLLLPEGDAPAPETLVHLSIFPRGAQVLPASLIAEVVWRADDEKSLGIAFHPGAARTVELALRSATAAADRSIAA